MLLGILGFGMGTTVAATDETNLNKATFAGGCFWCMVAAFDNLPGVVEVIAGYTGGIPKIQVMKKSRQAEPVTPKPYRCSTIPLKPVIASCWRPFGTTLTLLRLIANSATSAPSTVRRFFTMTRNNTVWPNNQRLSWRSPSPSRNRSSPKSRRFCILSRRRISPTLLPEKSGALSVLPLHLRQSPAFKGIVGRLGARTPKNKLESLLSPLHSQFICFRYNGYFRFLPCKAMFMILITARHIRISLFLTRLSP